VICSGRGWGRLMGAGYNIGGRFQFGLAG
jgi:hypothetical protein